MFWKKIGCWKQLVVKVFHCTLVTSSLWMCSYQSHEIFHNRSSHPEVFCQKGALRNFAISTGKHLRQSLFFNKKEFAACNFIKKETLAQGLSCGFCQISKNTFSYKTPPVAASAIIAFSQKTTR